MNEIINIPTTMPAAIINRLREADQSLTIPTVSGPIFPRISSNRRMFSIVESGADPIVIKDEQGNPVHQLDVVILGANMGVYKTFYAKGYDSKAAVKEAPICWSATGEAPHPSVDVKARQSDRCATCKQNVFGSKINPNGKKAKACSDSKRLLVVSPDDLEGPIYMVNISATALKSLNTYHKYLNHNNAVVQQVATRLSFDESSDVPVFQFAYVGALTQEDFNKVIKRLEEPEVIEFMEGTLDTETDAPRNLGPDHDEEEVQTAPAPAAPAPAPAPAPKAEEKPARKGFGGATKSKPAAEAAPAPAPKVEDTAGAPDISDILDF